MSLAASPSFRCSQSEDDKKGLHRRSLNEVDTFPSTTGLAPDLIWLIRHFALKNQRTHANRKARNADLQAQDARDQEAMEAGMEEYLPALEDSEDEEDSKIVRGNSLVRKGRRYNM